MRNTTKLKMILYKYMVSFELNDAEVFVMTIVDKFNDKSERFEAKSYSLVISKAYSYLLRELKSEEKLR